MKAKVFVIGFILMALYASSQEESINTYNVRFESNENTKSIRIGELDLLLTLKTELTRVQVPPTTRVIQNRTGVQFLSVPSPPRLDEKKTLIISRGNSQTSRESASSRFRSFSSPDLIASIPLGQSGDIEIALNPYKTYRMTVSSSQSTTTDPPMGASRVATMGRRGARQVVDVAISGRIFYPSYNEYKTYFERGASLLESGNSQSAADALKQALVYKPDDFEAKNLLSKAQKIREEENRKIENENNFASAMKEGIGWLDQNEFSSSAAAFERARSLNPGDSRVNSYLEKINHLRAAENYFAQGSWSDAISEFKNAADVFGMDDRIRERIDAAIRNSQDANFRDFTRIAENCERQGQLEEAIQAYAKAAQIKKESSVRDKIVVLRRCLEAKQRLNDSILSVKKVIGTQAARDSLDRLRSEINQIPPADLEIIVRNSALEYLVNAIVDYTSGRLKAIPEKYQAYTGSDSAYAELVNYIISDSQEEIRKNQMRRNFLAIAGIMTLFFLTLSVVLFMKRLERKRRLAPYYEKIHEWKSQGYFVDEIEKYLKRFH